MKFLFLFTLIWSIQVSAFEMGFNQAWLKNKYAHQWINYDEIEAERILNLAKDANAKIVRMWLFEGTNAKGITWENGLPKKLNPKFSENLEHFIQFAQTKNLKLNFTLFDGNIITHNSFDKYKDRWWNLLNNKYKVADHFLKNIINPIVKVLNQYPDVVLQIDLVNEINALNGVYYIYPYMFKNQWRGLNSFVCKWSKHLKSNLDYKTNITASLGWGLGVDQVLSNKLNVSCIDFYQIHIYRNDGVIPSCNELKKFSKTKNRPLQLGEFGQKSKSFNDELQSMNLKNFIKNAKRCGFQSALAWRLSDIRSGVNKEARFSFEAYGKPRPAYYIFKDLAQK